MKCPKCGYLGFEHVERCRNCGYDFSLSSLSTLPDLSIRPSVTDTLQPLADLALIDAALTLPRPQASAAPIQDLRGSAVAAVGPTLELPLFGSAMTDDVPLITRPSPPRTPLAVRRATPEVPRLRAETRSPMLDFIPPEPEGRSSAAGISIDRIDRIERIERKNGHALPTQASALVLKEETAGLAARILAAVVDLTVLVAIDAAVVYFTMQICGVTFEEIAILPKTPLAAFLILQNIGYFVAFTAGGQTIGQMAFGIKVISEDAGASPDLSHALLRTLVWAVLAIPAGLGLMTALFTNDHRGLHDRCSGTRVVRATA